MLLFLRNFKISNFKVQEIDYQVFENFSCTLYLIVNYKRYL